MDAVNFMKNVSIFSHLSSRDLKRLAKGVKSQSFSKGDVIIREGETGTTLFVIIRGEVEVVKSLGSGNATRLHVFGAGSYFGEMALWDNLIRSASVVALRDTDVIYLDKFDFRTAIERSPGLAIEMLQMLNRRVRALEKSLAESSGGGFPQCPGCGRIRVNEGEWVDLEAYISTHVDSDFSRVLCTACEEKK